MTPIPEEPEVFSKGERLMHRTRPRLLIAIAIAATASLALSACSNSPDGGSSGGSASASASNEPITLTLNNWGEFGFAPIIAQYEAEHPNITVQINNGDYNTQHQNLQKFLVAGSGAPDIAMSDEGYIVQFRGQADKFVDLNTLGAGDYSDKFLDWDWQSGTAEDGTQFAIGDDVGGLAMCYRRDLFEAAGLPSDRAEVSALWPTWDDFIAAGEQYVAGSGGKKFVDSGVNIFNPAMRQQEVGFFDTEENLSMDKGPKVAWDIATEIIDKGLSANIPSQTPEWNAGMQNGDYAVLACPSWMLARIQSLAPDSSGQWDIADMPGGGGNWGGSFFMIPKQGKHIAEAWDVIKYLLAPENQISIFQNAGLLPAQPALYEEPALLDYANPYFNNAPVGEIFTTSAKNFIYQYQGLKSGVVRTAVEGALTQVMEGSLSATEGWDVAVTEAEKAAEG